jgi:hypothetical protein
MQAITLNGWSSKPSTTCFPGCAICLPTASITAPTSARPGPNLVIGRSRSSHAPPGLLAFNSFRADGFLERSKPPIGKGLRELNHPHHNLDLHRFHTASHQEIGGRVAQPMLAQPPSLHDRPAPRALVAPPRPQRWLTPDARLLGPPPPPPAAAITPILPLAPACRCTRGARAVKGPAGTLGGFSQTGSSLLFASRGTPRPQSDETTKKGASAQSARGLGHLTARRGNIGKIRGMSVEMNFFSSVIYVTHLD